MLIKINLLGERKKKGGKAILWLASYGFAMLVCCAVYFIMLMEIDAVVSDKGSQVSLLEAQLVKLRVVTKEVRDLAEKKQSLGEKIAVMASLRKKKIGPVRVMDDLNISVPEKAWVTEVKEVEGGSMKISGFALDNQTIAVFMKALDVSEYFSDVDLIETKQAKIKDVGVKEFTLQSRVNYMGKIIPDASPIVLPVSEVAPNAEVPAELGAPAGVVVSPSKEGASL